MENTTTYTAMIKGNAGTPARFWNKAVAENQTEVDTLLKQGYVLANVELKSLNEARKFIR